jgi:hypothetical protein
MACKFNVSKLKQAKLLIRFTMNQMHQGNPRQLTRYLEVEGILAAKMWKISMYLILEITWL